jgi:hypothetical protein
MAMEVGIITEGSSRDELIEAIGHMNREARRCLARDHLNRPNERWAHLHEFINSLLDLLQQA